MSQVTEQEIGTLLSAISRIDDAGQLKRVREALSHRQIVVGQATIRKIRVGNRVKWDGKLGARQGVVLKVKQKYVEVKADASFGPSTWLRSRIGSTWNVPASMLTVIQ